MNITVVAALAASLLAPQATVDEFSVCTSPRCEAGARAEGTITWFDTSIKAQGTLRGESPSVSFTAYAGDTPVGRAESTDRTFDLGLDRSGAIVDRVTIQVCSDVPAPPHLRFCNRPPLTLRRSAA